MKLSLGSPTLCSQGIPREYFSKYSNVKPKSVKGIPILSKLNAKSKAFDIKKWAKTSRSAYEGSEFETSCSETGQYLNKLQSTSQHRSKNIQILIANYESKKLKSQQNSNPRKIMLERSKVKKEWYNLEQQLGEVLQLIKEEKEIARFRIQQIRQRVQNHFPQRVDASQNTCQNDFVLLLKQARETEVQTIKTENAATNQNENQQTLHKIAFLMKDMNMEPYQSFGKEKMEIKQNSINLSNIEECQVIKLNKLIIKKLVQRITQLQSL